MRWNATEYAEAIVRDSDNRIPSGKPIISKPLPVQQYIDQQDIRGNMACGTCRRDLWDCRCPQHVECKRCGIEQEDAAYMEARREAFFCPGSTDGLHVFVSADKEP